MTRKKLKNMLFDMSPKIKVIAAKYGIRNIRVYGSVVRGEAGPNSDIDLLVDVEEGRDLFDLGGFQYETQELLGRKVDVATINGLNQMIKDIIVNEAKPL